MNAYKKTSKLLIATAAVTILGGTQTALAMDCWKATSVNSGFPQVFQTVAQDCSSTPAGYAWVDRIHDPNGLGMPDYHLAVQPAMLINSSTIVTYMGDEGGEPVFHRSYLTGLNTGPQKGLSTTAPADPAPPGIYWTGWLNRDGAGGSGDWEIRSLYAASDVCEHPRKIETRVSGTSTVYTPQDITPDPLAAFDKQVGVVCRNADAPGGCSDYETRFECQAGTWTDWLSRDQQGGSGDWELHSLFSSSQVCANPLDIRARIVNTSAVFAPGDTTPHDLAVFNAEQGLVCSNNAQWPDSCQDYEIRFLCP